MSKLPAKWNSLYWSPHISKLDGSSPLPMKINTSYLRNKFKVIFKRFKKKNYAQKTKEFLFWFKNP
jgi:hypothetical protein